MKINKPFVLWFTGLSGAGKSTLSDRLFEEFQKNALLSIEKLDGDEIRENLSRGLGFSKADRDINIRRIGWVCSKLFKHGVSVFVSAISPYKDTRLEVRNRIGENFIEVYMSCSLENCEKKDVKGLYKKARTGEIKKFTGIDDPYEAPSNPEINIDSSEMDLEKSKAIILDYLYENNYLV